MAKKILKAEFGVEVLAWVSSVKHISSSVDRERVKASEIEANVARCPDAKAAEKMIRFIRRVRSEGDSVGGVIEAVARRVPPGWGEPVFDRLEADLAKGMLSLPASKGFEIGSGFEGVKMTGREHNDPFRMRRGQVRTVSNRSGGVQGGISNGETGRCVPALSS